MSINKSLSSTLSPLWRLGATLSVLGLSVAAFGATAATPPAAQAQTAPPKATPQAAAKEEELQEIVVTGTQIRGIKPPGSNALAVTREQIEAAGVVDTNLLIAQLPQSGSFLTVPQAGSVGQFVQNNGGQSYVRLPTTSPKLRNIGGPTATGAQTLVLMDGHRVVPGGIFQTVVDATIVPGGMLEQLEVILDGTSSVYGSDAAGGVMNFITRKRMQGTEVSAQYGFADNYWQASTSITSGTSWGSGGISFNVNLAKNTNILSSSRSYLAPINFTNPLQPNGVAGNTATGSTPAVDDLTCDNTSGHSANVSAGAGAALVTAHASGAGLAAGYDLCYGTQTPFADFQPSADRHSIFSVFSQNITDHIKLDVTGTYSENETVSNLGPILAAVTVRGNLLASGTSPAQPAHPYYRTSALFPLNANGTLPNQTVSFTLAPVLGDRSLRNYIDTQQGQINPELTIDLPGRWQARASLGYGVNSMRVVDDTLDTVSLNALFPGGTSAVGAVATPLISATINPYDLGASTNNGTSALNIGRLLRQNVTTSVHKMRNARALADGPLFTWRGGEVRSAVGVEFTNIKVSQRLANFSTFLRGPELSATDDSKGVFAEIVVPVIGPDNRLPGVESLLVSASGRYDDYGPLTGRTFNKKFSLTWQPVKSVSIRGNWGTSFRGPDAIDRLGQLPSAQTINCDGPAGSGCARLIAQNLPYAVPGTTGNSAYPDLTILAALSQNGTRPDLKPETSRNWAIGMDFEPPFISGVTISGTYWNVEYTNQITGGSGAVNSQTGYDNGQVTLNPLSLAAPGTTPSAADVAAFNAAVAKFVSDAPGGAAILAGLPTGYIIGALYDARTRNFNATYVAGVDGSVRYRKKTGFGSISASFSGAWLLKSKSLTGYIAGVAQISDGLRVLTPTDATFPATTTFKTIRPRSVFSGTLQLAADIGDFRTGASLRHLGGYDLTTPTIAAVTLIPSRVLTQTKGDAFDVLDLNFGWNVHGSTDPQKNLRLSLIVNNVLNTTPTVTQSASATTQQGQTIGRTYVFGVTKKF